MVMRIKSIGQGLFWGCGGGGGGKSGVWFQGTYH